MKGAESQTPDEYPVPADRIWIPVTDLPTALSAWETLRRGIPNPADAPERTEGDNA